MTTTDLAAPPLEDDAEEERLPFRFGELRLDILEPLTIEQWGESLGHAVGRVAKSSPWYVGDWLLYGEARFGDSATAYEGEVGLEPKTLLNYRRVAEVLTPVERRPELDFGHHEAVVSLEPQDRKAVLDEAVAKAWTVKQTREAARLRKARPQSERLPGTDDDADLYTKEDELRDLRYVRERVARVLETTETPLDYLETRLHELNIGKRPPRWNASDALMVDEALRALRLLVDVRDVVEKGAK